MVRDLMRAAEIIQQKKTPLRLQWRLNTVQNLFKLNA